MNSVKRLYTSFKPSKYDLFINIDTDKLKFSGKVIIHGLKTGRPSNRITFHQKDLNISKAKITFISKDNEVIEVDRINKHKKFDEVRLHTKNLLRPGKYEIEIDFDGHITDQLNGIYPSKPKNGSDKNDIIIATQFESHHAREAFVCIDEPEAKAVFNLVIESDDKKAIISNTSVKSLTKSNGRVTTVFDSTPIMSTYLLAFVIGNLDHHETTTKSGIKVRTYATPELINDTKFALKTAAKILEFYEDYFDIPYPLDKCDFIALPDFASGAMENWGCITFRDQALLVDKHSSLNITQYVANVIAHELTHQWFGNLVTMQWWTDLWLNESFASWMSYLGVDHLYPEWQVWTQFINDEQTPALKLDGLENTHPIEVPIHHPDEIRTIFDQISYEKGASIIRMIESYVGHENFKNGIRKYLKSHSYSNTQTEDLWKALSVTSKQDVSKIMDKWIKQPGYPIIEVTSKENTINVTQKRFNYLKNKNDLHWPVPIALSIKDKKIVNKAIESFMVNKPVIINHNLSGFYRTIYDDNYVTLLLEDIDNLSEIDRLGILRDAFAASCAGYYPTTEVLKLLSYYKNEKSLVVWEIITSILANIRHIIADKELRVMIKPYILDLTSEQYKRLTWDEKKDDSYFDKLLRPIILSLSAVAKNQEVLEKIKIAFKEKDKNPIKGDYRGFIYSSIARNGSEKEFEKLLKMHKETNSPEEKLQLSFALTNFKQTSIHKKVLDYIKSSDVRTQDSMYWISGSFSNIYSREMTWSWIQENWKWLKDTQGNDLSFYRIPNIVAANISDKKFLREYKDFFTSKMNAAFDRPIKQGIETIKWQSAWKERDLVSIKKWFKDYSKG